MDTKNSTATITKKKYRIQDFLDLVNASFVRLEATENAQNQDDYEIELESAHEHMTRVRELLPKFTPMMCENCSKRKYCFHNTGTNVCGSYTVTED